MEEKPFISISGIIGAGKTTLATALSKVMNLSVYYESVIDNVYLSDFYNDQKKYAFNLQIYLLNKRFAQYQEIVWSKKGSITDRSIFEDKIFAKVLYEEGNMEQRDYNTYLELFSNMSNFMKKNTLIIHLDITPEQALERIRERNRECEKNIPLIYLQRLHTGYTEFISHISTSIPVISVKYDKFKTAEEIAQVIKKEFESMKNIKKVFY